MRISLLVFAAVFLSHAGLHAQSTRIRDLTVAAGDIPVRLVGYGLVVGLDGTGDRVIGGFSAGHTVRSVANLLRRFRIEVPENMLRTRNVAAVLVTAETSPYLRPGGRFDVHVASVGDAVSLRGGILWMTPLQVSPNTPPVATAQGALLVSESTDGRSGYAVETAGILPEGGILEQPLARPDFQSSSTLLLRNPDLATAIRIADAINAEMGEGTATAEDPGAVRLQVDADQELSGVLARAGEISVVPERAARVVIDGRAGTVIAGGSIEVGQAVVSHGGMTLNIGGPLPDSTDVPSDLRMGDGATVQNVAAALHSVAAPPQAIAAVFEALRQVGAIAVEVVVR
ncbi:MAG: flagellar basal body P-ring protein FlgI [Gemmatimonadota bacterium]